MIVLDGTSGITSPNETITGSLNTPNTFAYKNLLIDAGFTINQRGYVSAATLASGAYGHDRWKAGASGGDYSFTQSASNTQITIASGKSLIQVVEDKNVSGTSYVLSWTGTAQARYAVNSATPAGSYAASPIVITGQTAGTTMSVEFNTGTLSKPQLELGAVATSFDQRAYSQELAMCQRYLPASNSTGAPQDVAWGFSPTATLGWVLTNFLVTPRVPPTGIFVPDATKFSIVWTGGGGGAIGAGGILFSSGSYSTGRLGLSISGAPTSGGAILYANGIGAQILWTGCEL